MKGVKIQGQYFGEMSDINLFLGKKSDRNNNLVDDMKQFSIIYGPNGSGKTSIANALFSFSVDNNESFIVEPYDENNNLLSKEDVNLKVFSENFTTDKVTFSQNDSLDAIILFGECGDIENKINDVQKEKEQIDNEIAKYKSDLEHYKTQKDPLNIEESKNKILLLLKNNWANRESEIKGLTRKANVDADLFKSICCLNKPENTQKELSDRFKIIVENIKSARNLGQQVNNISFPLPFLELTKYNDILSSSFPKKQMTSFAEKVLHIIEEDSSRFLQDTKDTIASKNVCPLCFQNLSEDYKKDLHNALDELFDDTVEKEIEKIEQIKLPMLNEPDLSSYENIIDAKQTIEFSNFIKQANEIIKLINDKLTQKIGSIYLPSEKLEINLDEFVNNFKSFLLKLNSKIDSHNKSIEDLNKNIAEARKINLSLSYFETNFEVVSYKKLLDDYNKINENLNKKLNESKEKDDEILKLNAGRNNSSIALDEINENLAYIFNSRNRLKLEPDETGIKYLIFSKGKKIKAKKLSTGERNLISFVYFYEQLKSGCDKGKYFKEKSTFIIDDPISSFDYENKLGILSFIKKFISEIYDGNKESKICFLTHELEVGSFISRIFDDLDLSKNTCTLVLENKKTEYKNFTKYTTYGKLMVSIFDYAKTEDHTKDIVIGNMIRRLVETYAIFNYNETMDKFLTKSQYLNKINNESLKDYFSNRMTRLLLNENSHMENPIRAMTSIVDFEMFSDIEKIQTAKDVIVFLYSLDNQHVLRFIKPENEKYIKEWQKSIIESASIL